MEPSYLTADNGDRLAYHYLEGKSPGVIFFGGFRSDMNGSKALRLEAFCRARGQAFLCFDYHGHGQSEGKFEEGTIGRWAGNALDALDRLTAGPQIIVGSSMGGWLMLLATLARPERIAGLIGIAAAPDFTEDLIWPKFTPRQKEEVLTLGATQVPSEYGGSFPITRNFIEEARNLLLLNRPEPLPIACPVRLLHGMEDADVPWTLATRLAHHLTSKDVQVEFIPGGDHRLSSEEHLVRLEDTLDLMIRAAASG